MTDLNEIKGYVRTASDIASFTKLLNNEAKNIPISKLLSNMDSNKDKILTTDEIYEGLIKNCSESLSTLNTTVNLADSVCNFFNDVRNFLTDKDEPNKKSKEVKSNNQNNIDDCFEKLGINSSQIKRSIDTFAGKDGIDITNIEETVSALTGTDINTILANAKKYGININLKTLSINDIEKLINTADGAIAVLDRYESMNKDFSNGNIFSGISGATELLSAAYDLYNEDPFVKDCVNKAWVNTRDTAIYEINKTWVDTRDTVCDAALKAWRWIF